MDDKHSHIEDWLRKAAARQDAPEDSGAELKRQSWSKMAALLDEEDAAKPKPRILRFRFNRAAIIIPFVATGLFAAAMWVAPHFLRETKPGGASSGTQTHSPHKHKPLQTPETLNTNNIAADSSFIPANSNVLPGIPAADSSGVVPATITGTPGAGDPALPINPALTAAEKRRGDAARTRAAANDQLNNSVPPATIARAAAGSMAAPAAGHTNTPANNHSDRPVKSAGHQLTAAKKGNVIAKEGKGQDRAAAPGAMDGNHVTAAKGYQQSLLHNKVNNTSVPGTADDNEPVAGVPTVKDKRFSWLNPLVTPNVFASPLATLSAGSRHAGVPVSASGSGGLSMGATASRWGLQLGVLSPLSSALGLRVGVLYIYPLGNNWFLQPQLSASYITGYNKVFSHVAVSKYRIDTTGGGIQDRYNVDTTRTPYTFRRAFAGSAGINVGYHRNKLAVSSGLVYSMAAASGTKDSATVSSRIIRDTTLNPGSFTDPAFSPGRLPGRNQLSWNLDLSWYVSPRLQAGFNYRVVLWRSAGDKGFQAPLQRIQDNSLLELYIRIPIGKK
ncbi:hypothetical protein [uncultured Chitinophaga sp.]|jgi:hypothetical protein|uniref:hypothetical protein n=1 Tax=uncultured Chitinophaga sp. TaxID=339340 RepID=UPI0026370153|nr:hypothetical protein [uncultured Chitinophaga sp.]